MFVTTSADALHGCRELEYARKLTRPPISKDSWMPDTPAADCWPANWRRCDRLVLGALPPGPAVGARRSRASAGRRIDTATL